MLQSKSDSHQKKSGLHRLWNRWVYLFRFLKLMISLAPKEMSVILSITILTGFIPLLSIVALERLVNSIALLSSETPTIPTEVIIWVSLFIAAMILQSTSNIYGRMLKDHAQEKIKVSIQKQTIKKTHSLELAQFENAKLYDQLQRANSGVETKLFSTMNSLFLSISQSITIISVLVYLTVIHWVIPLILFIGSLIFTLVKMGLFIERYLLDRKQTTEIRKLNYLERLMTFRDAAREIRLYDLADHLRKHWQELNEKTRNERLDLAKKESKKELVSSSGNTLTFAIVLAGIIYIASMGMLSVGQYAAFIRAVIQFQTELSQFFLSIAFIDNDLRYIKDFFEYLDLPEEEVSGERVSLDNSNKNIELKNVYFAYPGSNRKVLDDINLTIKSNERIAIVGDNGSGKTTLVKLLLGLYKPTNGRVIVEGKDLQKTNLFDWRKKCTAIFQDFYKYNLTIKENIAIGNIQEQLDFDRIKSAAGLSGTDEVVLNLPDGYETLLGKEFNGSELSEGQWQRIAIARAYMRDPKLLILDEPTASLDPKSEVEVYRQFKNVTKGKASIFISHRLGICQLADRIIVLDNGQVAEQGTHEELLRKNGHYAHMYNLQAQWYA